MTALSPAAATAVNTTHKCSFSLCEKPSGFMVACPTCEEALYCGRGCLKADWKNHQVECLLMKQAHHSAGTEADPSSSFVVTEAASAIPNLANTLSSAYSSVANKIRTIFGSTQ